MAVCTFCEREMREAGCTLETYDDYGDSVTYQRTRFGEESWWETLPFDPPVPCHDCGVGLGDLHHPRCDMEQCPRCGGQAISCECPIMDAASPRLPILSRADESHDLGVLRDDAECVGRLAVRLADALHAHPPDLVAAARTARELRLLAAKVEGDATEVALSGEAR